MKQSITIKFSVWLSIICLSFLHSVCTIPSVLLESPDAAQKRENSLSCQDQRWIFINTDIPGLGEENSNFGTKAAVLLYLCCALKMHGCDESF